jgi:hypothetical protein
MRINELISEQQQIDELNLKGLGTGLGKAVGAVAGGAVQGAKNVWAGAKQGYQAGQTAVAPDGQAPATAPAGTAAAGGWGTPTATTPPPATTPAPASTAPAGTPPATGTSTPAPAAPTGNAPATTPPATPPAGTAPPAGEAPNPAADQQSKVGVGQINKIIPTLRTRDLTSVKKTVDATIAKKAKPAPAAPAPTAPAGPTQAELDADHARMASGTNESKVIVFRSRFLGMDI